MKILFIQTGGTIDKDYPKVKGYAFEISEPAVKRVLKNIGPAFDYETVSLMKKDSQDITDSDRKMIYDYCSKSSYDKILITHGTDTMLRTADRLSRIKGKTIILTGSMKPEIFKDSDAEFNIGTAIGAINAVKDGVYIAMNGRIYPWNSCRRNPKGQFIEK